MPDHFFALKPAPKDEDSRRKVHKTIIHGERKREKERERTQKKVQND